MSDSEGAQQIKDMIRKHLEQVGAARWKAIRLQCPEISDATFWRYVKAVRDEAPKDEGPDEASKPIFSHPQEEVPRLGALPAFYNPLQKARLYESLLADAEIMRSQSVDHRGRITNWRMFEKSIRLRERLVAQQGEMINFFQDQDAINLFFAEVMEMAKDLPKEAAEKFVRRLHAIQQRRLAAPQSNITTTGAGPLPN